MGYDCYREEENRVFEATDAYRWCYRWHQALRINTRTVLRLESFVSFHFALEPDLRRVDDADKTPQYINCFENVK